MTKLGIAAVVAAVYLILSTVLQDGQSWGGFRAELDATPMWIKIIAVWITLLFVSTVTSRMMNRREK